MLSQAKIVKLLFMRPNWYVGQHPILDVEAGLYIQMNSWQTFTLVPYPDGVADGLGATLSADADHLDFKPGWWG